MPRNRKVSGVSGKASGSIQKSRDGGVPKDARDVKRRISSANENKNPGKDGASQSDGLLRKIWKRASSGEKKASSVDAGTGFRRTASERKARDDGAGKKPGKDGAEQQLKRTVSAKRASRVDDGTGLGKDVAAQPGGSLRRTASARKADSHIESSSASSTQQASDTNNVICRRQNAPSGQDPNISRTNSDNNLYQQDKPGGINIQQSIKRFVRQLPQHISKGNKDAGTIKRTKSCDNTQSRGSCDALQPLKNGTDEQRAGKMSGSAQARAQAQAPAPAVLPKKLSSIDSIDLNAVTEWLKTMYVNELVSDLNTSSCTVEQKAWINQMKRQNNQILQQAGAEFTFFNADLEKRACTDTCTVGVELEWTAEVAKYFVTSLLPSCIACILFENGAHMDVAFLLQQLQEKLVILPVKCSLEEVDENNKQLKGTMTYESFKNIRCVTIEKEGQVSSSSAYESQWKALYDVAYGSLSNEQFFKAIGCEKSILSTSENTSEKISPVAAVQIARCSAGLSSLFMRLKGVIPAAHNSLELILLYKIFFLYTSCDGKSYAEVNNFFIELFKIAQEHMKKICTSDMGKQVLSYSEKELQTVFLKCISSMLMWLRTDGIKKSITDWPNCPISKPFLFLYKPIDQDLLFRQKGVPNEGKRLSNIKSKISELQKEQRKSDAHNVQKVAVKVMEDAKNALSKGAEAGSKSVMTQDDTAPIEPELMPVPEPKPVPVPVVPPAAAAAAAAVVVVVADVAPVIGLIEPVQVLDAPKPKPKPVPELVPVPTDQVEQVQDATEQVPDVPKPEPMTIMPPATTAPAAVVAGVAPVIGLIEPVQVQDDSVDGSDLVNGSDPVGAHALNVESPDKDALQVSQASMQAASSLKLPNLKTTAYIQRANRLITTILRSTPLGHEKYMKVFGHKLECIRGALLLTGGQTHHVTMTLSYGSHIMKACRSRQPKTRIGEKSQSILEVWYACICDMLKEKKSLIIAKQNAREDAREENVSELAKDFYKEMNKTFARTKPDYRIWHYMKQVSQELPARLE